MYCEKCGKELHDGASFCSFCGRKVESYHIHDEEPYDKRQEDISTQRNTNGFMRGRIRNGLKTLATIFILALAATIGKLVVHEPSVSKVLSYTLPGVLTGCVVAGIMCMFYSRQKKVVSSLGKWGIWIVSIVGGIIAGVFGAVVCGCVCGLILCFVARK